MSVFVFLLLMGICLSFIYLVHKYFGKEQFYLLGIIYSIISFVLSFKLVNILGVHINANIIFTSGIIAILYYFVNRYNDKESRRFLFTTIATTLVCICLFILTTLMTPSIYDKMSIFYQNLILDNLSIVILYPVSFIVTMFLSEYCFRELKREQNKKTLKTLLTMFGIIFIDVIVFIYFSYAFIIRFDTAIMIAIDNYFIKIGIILFYMFIVNKLFMIRKVK